MSQIAYDPAQGAYNNREQTDWLCEIDFGNTYDEVVVQSRFHMPNLFSWIIE